MLDPNIEDRNEGLVIRPLKTMEIDEMLEIWRSTGLPCKPMGRDSPSNIEKEMTGEKALFLAAVRQSRIIGTVLCTHDGRKGWINRLAVVPEDRGKGVARSLLQAGEKWLRDQGIGIFACLVEGDNTVSMDVIEKMGYREFPGVKYFTKRVHPDI
jgi:ribosomal protein S18 acetylase RimI-like enzyme